MVLAKLKFQHLGRDLMKAGDFTDICQQGTALCSKLGAAECLSKWGALQKIKNYQSASVAGMPALMYSVMRCHLVT